MPSAARITHSSDMIDIHSKADGDNRHIGQRIRSLEHDPEKVDTGFRERSCFNLFRFRAAERCMGYPFTRSTAATTFFARNWEMIEVRCLRL
jgi:hypothetical protein